MKNFCEKQHQHREWRAVFVDVWSLTFFSHLLLDRQKDEYLCSFLEAVPRLVIRHSLQPLVSISAEACCCCCWSLSSSSSSKETSKLLASEPDSESLSATRISLMACSSIVIFFTALQPTPTTVCLIYTPLHDWHSYGT